jgi:hypothetical protein
MSAELPGQLHLIRRRRRHLFYKTSDGVSQPMAACFLELSGNCTPTRHDRRSSSLQPSAYHEGNPSLKMDVGRR